jgi:hypothetical protein
MSTRFQLLLFGSVARRIMTLTSLVLLCAVFGLVMGKIILENFDAKETADIFKGVTYASVAFALWKLIADSWHVLWRFLGWDENRQALLKPLGQLAVAVTGVGLVTGYANSESPKRDPALVIASSIYIGNERVGADARRIMLPYFTTRPGEEDQSRENCDAYTDELAKLDKAGEDAVKTLACGLRACSVSTKRVEVDVRGFASSRPVQCGGQESGELNLTIAEKRRKNVLKLLQRPPSQESCELEASSAEFTVLHNEKPNRWTNLEEMESERDLVDRKWGDPAEVDRAREILTRRVDVVIESPGACRDTNTSKPDVSVASSDIDHERVAAN